ncbi:MAG TPA: Clp protease N-terminal domain-containing protein [Gemmatimonadaceae bacterium]|jgi:ATP-dependent Clp protease ATP-binding subunit ClpC|nr:Clp protease N-terminal domain-containing protein [Gemmatimonadaceae bacterium]
MNGFTFSDAVRSALGHAHEEAARLHYEYVGTEHILLGLLHDEENLAVQVLRRQQVSVDEVRAEVEREAKPSDLEETGPDLPYSHRSKRTLEEAMAEARNMGDNYLDTGHLLLGLVRDKRDLGAQVLNALGVSRDSARVVYRALRDAGKADPGGAGAPPAARGAGRPPSPGAGLEAWYMLEMLANNFRYAPVFQSHGIDVKKLVEDIRRVDEQQ